MEKYFVKHLSFSYEYKVLYYKKKHLKNIFFIWNKILSFILSENV